MKKQTQAVAVKTENTKKHVVKVQPVPPSTTQQDPGGCRPTGT